MQKLYCGNKINTKTNPSVKRSNARVDNSYLRFRTKSENSILCGNNNYIRISDDNVVAQLNQSTMSVDEYTKSRPNKRHISNTKDNEVETTVTAIYDYVPSHKDELSLNSGDKVTVLSNDFRDSGSEGWWVGLREQQIGIFPVSYVHTESSWSLIKGASEHSIANEIHGISIDDYAAPHMSENVKNTRNGFTLSGGAGVRTIPSVEISMMECLGSGSFGVVYRGLWQGKDVAVKTFAVTANEVSIYQEASHLSCLLHPNIVRLFGVSIVNDMGNQIALIMEYARGGALHNFLHFKSKIKLSPHTLLQMSKQIAIGMRYLHKEAAICHRDLKSSNVLIKEAISEDATDDQIGNCTLLITDFGMARRTAELVSQQSKLGTLAYAAPEVCRQQGKFSVKSDVWSYGVLLWELLTKEIPFRNVEQPHLLYKIAIKKQTLYIPSGIPSLLVNLLSSCWNEEKDLRPDFGNIIQVLNRAEKCSFVKILAGEFHAIQETWREEICSSEKSNNESVTSLEAEHNEYTEQKKEIKSAKEELLRWQDDILRREAACSEAMGTVHQFKIIFSVLVANQIPQVSGVHDRNNPPVPPPRKLPFVGRLKFWRHANHDPPSHNRSNDYLSATTVDNPGGNPNISAPSNLQHMVHISKQDFNLASPAFNFATNTRIFPTPVSFEDLSVRMDCLDSAGSPSPCGNTPNSTGGMTEMCSSAPNLRNLSVGNPPFFDFSSFRRPVYNAKDNHADRRKRNSCERCHWRKTNKSATVKPNGVEEWSCIPSTPPEFVTQKFDTSYHKKYGSGNYDSKRNKKTKTKDVAKPCQYQVDQAMWSVMRMLSAVVLPDRDVDKNTSEVLTAQTRSPIRRQAFSDQRSPALSLDIMTEDELANDSVFSPAPHNKTVPRVPSRPQAVPRSRHKPSHRSEAREGSLRGSSVPPLARAPLCYPQLVGLRPRNHAPSSHWSPKIHTGQLARLM